MNVVLAGAFFVFYGKLDGFMWFSMVFYGYLWFSMVFYGFRYNSTLGCCMLLFTVFGVVRFQLQTCTLHDVVNRCHVGTLDSPVFRRFEAVDVDKVFAECPQDHGR